MNAIENKTESPDATSEHAGAPTYLTRDPDDIVTISTLFKILWVVLFALVLSAGVNMFLTFRKADRIVVDRSSGRVVELNNRDYGSTESVSISPGQPDGN